MATNPKKDKEKRASKVPSISGIPNTGNPNAPSSNSGGSSSVTNEVKSPLPSTRRKSQSSRTKPIKVEQPQQHKQHRFQKKTFSSPTWCQFANKFIWGLNKSGYECRVCGMPVSRRFIADAKKTFCGIMIDKMDDAQTAALTEKKVFTIYLPHGAKKSIIMNPDAILGSILERICRERGIDIGAYVPEDTNGKVLKLSTQLGKIEGNEITFTAKDEAKQSDEQSHSLSNISSGSLNNKQKESKKKTSTQQLKPGISGDYVGGVSGNAAGEAPPQKKSVVEAYEFGQELGSGAFSIVRSATNKDTGQIVAIKILDKYEEDDEQTAKFKQEIAIISSLHHENIVKFHELDEDDENFYVVMELVGGGELFDFIINNGALPEADAAKVTAQVLKAVEYMHSVGTAHRDLKPENLLFSSVEEKVIKIADFGESKSFKEGTLSTYCGTPDYMAPEIIRGDNYGPEVDVWAVGVITYVMLAGFPPFDGENDVEVFASILSIKYDFPSPEWDKISPYAKEFIQAILVDKPEKRLTATQALAHKWIVDNVPSEFRINEPTTPVATLMPPSSSQKHNPPPSEEKKNIKKENKPEELPSSSATTMSTSSTTSTITPATPTSTVLSLLNEDLDFGKKPKKLITEVIDELLGNISETASANGNLDGVSLNFIGELRTIKTIVDGTTGKPKAVDLERLIYLNYWARLKAIHTTLKRGKKKSKSSNA